MENAGKDWFIAVVTIVLLVTLLELKPAWGGMLLLTVVTIMLARGIRSGAIEPPSSF